MRISTMFVFICCAALYFYLNICSYDQSWELLMDSVDSDLSSGLIVVFTHVQGKQDSNYFDYKIETSLFLKFKVKQTLGKNVCI